MLYEAGIADAFGSGYEFSGKQCRNLNYIKHPRHDIGLGCYSDDTQMMIALAELYASGEEWTRESVADHFVNAFRRDPRKGYSARVYSALASSRDGTDFLNTINPDSINNGAAMRAAPCGLFHDVGLVTQVTLIQASVTHSRPEAQAAALAVAFMSWYFHNTIRPKSKLDAFIEERVPGFGFSIPHHGPVGLNGTAAVRAAITAIMRNDSRSAMLKDCINFTGDVDTVAAIAFSTSAPCHEIKSDFPQHLCDGLENGRFGRNLLLKLDKSIISPDKAEETPKLPWRLTPILPGYRKENDYAAG